MQKKEIKKDKASVLAVTMIILGLVLSIALSASVVSILGNKASVSSNKSNLAYSRADSGIEDVLLKIRNSAAGDDISDIDSSCSGGVLIGDNFKIELKDEDENLITDCATNIAEVRSIKSTGIAEGNQRSIEVAVAAGAGVCIYNGATTSSFDGNDFSGYDGGDQKCVDAFGIGNRMCVASDFANGRPDASGWYNGFVGSVDGSKELDCNGWTKSDFWYVGNVWLKNSNRPDIASCNEKYSILCCECE